MTGSTPSRSSEIFFELIGEYAIVPSRNCLRKASRRSPTARNASACGKTASQVNRTIAWKLDVTLRLTAPRAHRRATYPLPGPIFNLLWKRDSPAVSKPISMMVRWCCCSCWGLLRTSTMKLNRSLSRGDLVQIGCQRVVFTPSSPTLRIQQTVGDRQYRSIQALVSARRRAVSTSVSRSSRKVP